MRVLFLCTHNSARSQMAEGWLRHLGGAGVTAQSAGTEETQVRPLAIEAMAEVGVDLSSHTSKTLDRFLEEPFDAVVTVCDDANEACPVFPDARRRLHWPFPDPSRATGTREEQLAVFRRVRDAIKAGQFNVHPVETIDQGIEILTGMTAGEREPDGGFPDDTFNRRVANRLRELAEVRARFGRHERDRDEETAT